MRSLIPLDIVDDLSFFRVAGVTQINGILTATGVLSRKGGFAAQVYSFGPDHWTMGRDLYIGNKLAAESDTVLVGQNAYVIPNWGGKFHLVGNTLYYVGISLGYKAPATNLVGYDNPALKDTITGFNNARMTFESNAANRLLLDLANGVSSAALRPSSEVDLEISYGGNYAQIGKYGVDQLTRGIEQAGKIYQLRRSGKCRAPLIPMGGRRQLRLLVASKTIRQSGHSDGRGPGLREMVRSLRGRHPVGPTQYRRLSVRSLQTLSQYDRPGALHVPFG